MRKLEHCFGEIIQSSPKAWVKSSEKEIKIRFQLTDNIVSFVLTENIDFKDTIIIDPSLTFSTFSGATSDNWGFTATPDNYSNLFGGGFRLDNNLGNPNLEPELKTEWEIGGDFRFLDDKVSLSFTYYDNIIEGILLDVSLSPSTGFSTQYGNYGEMTNNGIELDLGIDLINNNDFGLSTAINWSTNENEVTDLYGTETINLSPGASVSSRAIVGYSLALSRSLESLS